MFFTWKWDVYSKISILTHFPLVKNDKKAKPTFWGPSKFYASTLTKGKNIKIRVKMKIENKALNLAPKYCVKGVNRIFDRFWVQ